MFQFRQNSLFIFFGRFNKDIKFHLQKHNGDEQQRKRPDLNMTET